MIQIYRYLTMLLLITLLPIAGFAPAHAAAQSSQIDAVLVLDVSQSMSTSDPGGIGNEAMKMFIDMLSETGDQVGIVSYTDQIQREKALLEISSAADKTNLKQFIDQLKRGAYTDIAVGVKEAVQILNDGADPDHEPLIIVLADGNNDFNSKSGRTQADSDADMAAALKEATSKGYPVYTIGLNANGKLNKAALESVSQQTGGKSFSTNTAADLPQILSEIFASHLQLNVVPVDSFTADGNYQDVKISVPNSNVLEANISITSSNQVEARLIDPSGNKIAIPSDQVLLSTSKTYSLMKLLGPEEGDWTLQVKGADRDKIDINLIFNYDLALEMDKLKSSSYSKGDSIPINAYLVSGGNKLSDQEQYRNMKAVLFVNDLDTGQTEEVQLNHAGDHFEGTYKVADKHDYELKVRAEEASFYRETAVVKISAKGGASASTGTGAAAESDKPFPLIPVIIGALGLIALLVAAYFIMRYLKQARRGFVGQMVIEIRDENTGDKTFPQYKKLNAFRGKFSLHQLLQLAPELKETEKLIFVPGNSDRLVLRNGSPCTVEKSGRAVDASGGLEVKSGERLTIPLQQIDKTIFIEYIV
ncbi:von Willebrand factor type A domain-containing protein [Paenibacillus algorifonticola]|uniref:von Willebrand factor type A domain-containing protein n=1 Tax=Paenibacillus algorifonticola TaxID=684063 RepID=A0A1I2D6Z6_9BACL|nr:vWA domain-containing protein [Paenibacillus algorifonticola]SFE76302.1 von Willebrand factor type A domain-containing protein [Paenibacillus algorifonticola]